MIDIVPPNEKMCFRCKTVKPASAFSKNNQSKDGLHSYCKPCFWQWRVRDRDNTPEGYRKCLACCASKPLEEFYPNKSHRNGLGRECKDCCNKRMAQQVSLDEIKTHKECSICQELKPLGDFDKDKRTRDKLHPYCISCAKMHCRIKVRPKELLADGYKRCLRCDKIKPVSFFARRTKNADGLYSYCKNCSGERVRYVITLPAEKTCTHCKEVKPTNEFYVHNGASTKDGLSSWCKECTKEDARVRGQRSYTSLGSRKASLRLLYGITLEDYERMYHEQDGKCAACRQPETTMMRGRVLPLAVDHSRVHGNVRGLLCQKCNQALGLLMEDTERISGLLKYANKHVVR